MFSRKYAVTDKHGVILKGRDGKPLMSDDVNHLERTVSKEHASTRDGEVREYHIKLVLGPASSYMRNLNGMPWMLSPNRRVIYVDPRPE